MRVACLFALAIGLQGCGDDSSSAADAMPPSPDADPLAPDAARPDAAIPREVIMETQPLVPGELAEGIMTGGADDFAIIHLEAPAAELDWNIHGHAGGGTQTVYEELNKMVVDYTFTPEAQADWYLLLRNSGPTAMDIQVRVELHHDMQWEWQ